ncbi:MAG: DUF3606 domain-containing protein [Sporocytophaga sp.]|uniref:DUF3606 domain-containing protein n=1 Tax=Sporocytophaga sp. TaxID=2231183 RepID=UPI001B1854FB|nr:DUF3606 domain-containing protein [Sporocytophaga sp.]MBO9702246.1 DUF3606 domain-containing protein [Sporocytophaga sp.]
MPDNLKKKRPQDATRINIHEAWELNFWAEELGVSKTELITAVVEAGTSVAAVKKHLGKK